MADIDVLAQAAAAAAVPAVGDRLVAIQNGAVVSLDIPVENNLNLLGQLFPNFHRAIGRVLSGTGQGFLAMCGDSTMAGYAANAGVNDRAFAMPVYLAKSLTSLGIPSSSDSFVGNGSTQGALTDTRITLGANWVSGAFQSMGGGTLSTTTPGSTSSFLPLGAWNTVDIYFLRTPGGGGQQTVQIGGGAPQNVNTVGAETVMKVTLTSGAAAAIQALNVTFVSGGACFWDAAVCYDSANPKMNVINCGIGGAPSSQFVGSETMGNGVGLKTLAADLYYYEQGINDLGSNVTEAALTSNIDTTVQSIFKPSGDVILGGMTPHSYMSVGNAKEALGYAYIAAQRAIAKNRNVGFINMNKHCGTYESVVARGLMSDGLHPKKDMHAERANYLARIFAAL